MKKILCIDFDGCLHSYTSPWAGAEVVSDPPTPGAIEWLRALADTTDFKPCIYSSRSKEPGGIAAMRAWLKQHGASEALLQAIEFPTEKPKAYLTIDDRAICFRGVFPGLDEMRSFKTWNRP